MKILLFYLCGAVWSFSPSAMNSRVKQSLYNYPKDYERAVECANEFGRCDCNELGKLADELEECIETSLKDHSGYLCVKEASDSWGLSELLRLQRELLLRTDYWKSAHPLSSDMNQHEGDVLILTK